MATPSASRPVLHNFSSDKSIMSVSAGATDGAVGGARTSSPGSNVTTENYADMVHMMMSHRVSVGLSALPPPAVKKDPRPSVRPSLGKISEYNKTPDSGAADGSTPGCCDSLGASQLDPSLVMGMERTLFSAFNQSILLMMSGIGFMSVDEMAEEPTQFGTFLIIAGLVYALFSFGMHVWRLNRLKAGRGLYEHDSLIWTATLTTFIFLALAFEIYYGFRFPYLKRSKAVEVVEG